MLVNNPSLAVTSRFAAHGATARFQVPDPAPLVSTPRQAALVIVVQATGIAVGQNTSPAPAGIKVSPMVIRSEDQEIRPPEHWGINE